MTLEIYSSRPDDRFVDQNHFIGTPVQFRWDWPANPFRSSGRLYIGDYNQVLAYFRHRPYRRKCFFKTQNQEYIWKDVGIGNGWTTCIPGVLYDIHDNVIATANEMSRNCQKNGNTAHYYLFEIKFSQSKYYITYQHEILLKCLVDSRTRLLNIKDSDGNPIMHAEPGRFCKKFTQIVPCDETPELPLIFCIFANLSTPMSSGR